MLWGWHSAISIRFVNVDVGGGVRVVAVAAVDWDAGGSRIRERSGGLTVVEHGEGGEGGLGGMGWFLIR